MSKKVSQNAMSKLGGIKAAIEALQGLEKEDRLRILAQIALADPNLAEEIKKSLFQFEDICLLQGADFNKVRQKIERKVFLTALRGASEDLKQKINTFLSQRAADQLWDDVDAIGPQRRSEVQACQEEVIQIVRQMGDRGEIALPSKWSGDKVVA